MFWLTDTVYDTLNVTIKKKKLVPQKIHPYMAMSTEK